mmetsp:Transcript_15105/g.21375  ORF Transcript_15105/g.21375 Transcript_15105/m.21375 type:complete len:161 (+) Transcript_15105:30-512(+)
MVTPFYVALLTVTGPHLGRAKHGTPAERISSLFRVRLSARSPDSFTQHKVGSNTETEQLFYPNGLFESPNPLKGADAGSHASQRAQRALSPPTRSWHVEFSEHLKLITIPEHSLVDGDLPQQFHWYLYHFNPTLEFSVIAAFCILVSSPDDSKHHRRYVD